MKKSLAYFVVLLSLLMVGSVLVMTARFVDQIEHNKRLKLSPKH